MAFLLSEIIMFTSSTASPNTGLGLDWTVWTGRGTETKLPNAT